jgi:hypothetical protein
LPQSRLVRGTSRAIVNADQFDVRHNQMWYSFANVTVTVFGQRIEDPKLKTACFLLFIPVFLGIGAAACTQKMIAPGQHWKQPGMFDFFARRTPPLSLLTPLGQRLRIDGYILAGLGILGYIAVYFLVRYR